MGGGEAQNEEIETAAIEFFCAEACPSCRRALLRTTYQPLVDKMPFESCSSPLMYSMVVDDQPQQ
eukprot:2189039-Amphidinium_carterae.1